MFGNKMTRIARYAQKNKPEKLVKFLNDKDKSVVLAAIEGLGNSRKEEAFNPLIPLLRSPDEDICIQAIKALGTMGRAKARVHLEHMRTKENTKAVDDAIMEALSTLPRSE